MIIIGLTGSYAMGKSFASKVFKQLHVPVFDADEVVHYLLAHDDITVKKVARIFPKSYVNQKIDRTILGKEVLIDDKKLDKLESILHPEVAVSREIFLAQARRMRKKIVVLDIPLLFEGNLQVLCDLVLVVSAPLFVQKQRMHKRKQLDKALKAAILRRQVPDHVKKKYADVVIPTGLDKGNTFRLIKDLVTELRKSNG